MYLREAHDHKAHGIGAKMNNKAERYSLNNFLKINFTPSSPSSMFDYDSEKSGQLRFQGRIREAARILIAGVLKLGKGPLLHWGARVFF